MKQWIWVVLVVVVGWGCSPTVGTGDVGELPETMQDNVGNVETLSEVVFVTDTSDTSDAAEMVAEPDVDIADGLEVDSPSLACAPGEGCFLDECSENSQCQSGWCVEHMGEQVCTQSCQEECPPGWTCTQVGTGGPDVVFICVSNHPNLCRPCAEADDCAGVAGTEDACVAYGDPGSFCGGKCGEEGDCPWGFECRTVTTVDGIELEQCMAETGECPCTDTAVELGLFTPCQISNEYGTCEGKRVCGDTGLTDCDALVPVLETCNGMDDNCDGDVDEPVLVEGDFINLCNDDNDCTDDSCMGQEGCVNEVLESGDCSDANPCTVADHCVAGTCLGDPVECDDGNSCTDNVCTETGGCEYPENTESCDDADPCTVADQCLEGECEGTPVGCECQSDQECIEAFADSDLCNGTLMCDKEDWPYSCAIDPDTIIHCPDAEGDNTFCLQSHCEPTTGDCSLVADHDGFLCDNADACTFGTKCLEGLCSGGVPVNCNDGNPCTDDSCKPETGCAHVNNQAACSDGDVCTTQDMCVDGQCLGGLELECNDGSVCNGLESCNPALGCIAGMPLVCDDDNICTGHESCDAVTGCAVGIKLECDDDNLCTGDSCDAVVGCVNTNLTGLGCDDGNACTELDLCQDGVCKGTGQMECTDDNPCTDNTCDPAAGCVTTLNQAFCDDENICTTGDHCELGACIFSGELTCNDGNDCTDDSCDGQVGCQFIPNQVVCDDGNKCTEDDTCAGGLCISGSAVNCSDDNPCTEDLCDPDKECSNTNLPDNTLCSDVNPQEVCVSGECKCLPACDGKVCGDDGCGGNCGTCVGAQEECVDGLCECQPDCDGKVCGDDGCGGNCGTCVGAQEECVDGLCVCQPDCDGKICGDDGCGGNCGVCGDNEECTDGQCVSLCTPIYYGTAGQGINNGWTCDDVCGAGGGESVDWLGQQEQTDYCLGLHPGSQVIVANPHNNSYPIFDTQNGKNMCLINADGQKSQDWKGGGTPVYGDQILCRCERDCECWPACGDNEFCVEGVCLTASCPNGYEPVIGGPNGRSWWQSGNCSGTEYIEPPPFQPPWRPVPTLLCKATSGGNFSVSSVKTSSQCNGTSATASTIWLQVAQPL